MELAKYSLLNRVVRLKFILGCGERQFWICSSYLCPTLRSLTQVKGYIRHWAQETYLESKWAAPNGIVLFLQNTAQGWLVRKIGFLACYLLFLNLAYVDLLT